jgi:hypothetical protein
MNDAPVHHSVCPLGIVDDICDHTIGFSYPGHQYKSRENEDSLQAMGARMSTT